MSQGFDLNGNYYSFVNNNTVPLVFIHGVGLDHKMWKPQIDSLKNYSTLTYDLLGHGKTDLILNEITLDDFSSQLRSILKFLKIDKINLIGFSLGSLIAINFASNFQNVLEKLILIGTTYKRTDEQRAKVLERYEQAKLNKPISNQALERWFSDKYLKSNPEIYNQFTKILNKKPEDHLNFLSSTVSFIVIPVKDGFFPVKIDVQLGPDTVFELIIPCSYLAYFTSGIDAILFRLDDMKESEIKLDDLFLKLRS